MMSSRVSLELPSLGAPLFRSHFSLVARKIAGEDLRPSGHHEGQRKYLQQRHARASLSIQKPIVHRIPGLVFGSAVKRATLRDIGGLATEPGPRRAYIPLTGSGRPRSADVDEPTRSLVLVMLG